MENSFSWKQIFTTVINTARGALRKYSLFVLHLSPRQNIAQALLVYMFVGWIILSLPFMYHGSISLIDNLFTAASAASTAGLTSVNFAETYTFLGKLVVLVLIQVGGIGYMTMSSFLYLSFSHRLRKRHTEVLNTEFSLPRTVRLQDFLRAVVIFTFFVELIGTALLYNYFTRHGYSSIQALWYGAFHSISAFCTAGFSLFPDSFMSFADSKTINAVISCLSLAGAMGFIVVTDVFNRIFRRTQEISYTTKIIVLTTLSTLLIAGFILLLTNPGITPPEALFQATAAMTTAGFSTIPVANLAAPSLLILMALMSIGGSPSGTGGGVKTTAVTCTLAIVSSHLLGRRHITFLGRTIPIHRLYLATSTVLFYGFLLFITLFLLVWTENLPFLELFFEATAALSTGGMSAGATPHLSTLGKLIVILAMLVGRIGVVTFGLILLKRDGEPGEEVHAERADLAV